MPKVLIFLADGFEEIEALTVVDLLRRVNIQIEMVSISDSLEVTGAHNINVKSDVLFTDADFQNAEMLILPGGMPGTRNLEACRPLCNKLKEFHREGKMIGAICAAPLILGSNGILEGKKACCYPGYEEELTGATVIYDDVTVDGNIITSRGLGTAISFAHAIATRFIGLEKSYALLDTILYK